MRGLLTEALTDESASAALTIERLSKILGDLGIGKRSRGPAAVLKPKQARRKEPAPRSSLSPAAARREADEILARVRIWAGGEDAARLWFRGQPLPAFGDRTAESLVKSGQSEALRDYLDSLALGGFA